MAITLLVFAVLLIALALWLFGRAREVETRDAAITRIRSADAALGEGDAALPTAREIDNPLMRWCVQLLWRAGTEASSQTILRGLLLLAVLAALLLLIAGPIFGGMAAAGGLVLLWGVLAQRAARRRSLIVEQMPAYLENLIRVLAAGNSLEESLGIVARDSPDPIRPVFISVARQVKLGAPLDQVLADAGDVYLIRDLKVLSLAASINRRYGGSLRNVMKSLIAAIRARAASARELRALTAETRLSALILSVLPIGLTTYIYILNRKYYANILADPTGRALLIGSASLIVVGVFIIWRMLRSTQDIEA